MCEFNCILIKLLRKKNMEWNYLNEFIKMFLFGIEYKINREII